MLPWLAGEMKLFNYILIPFLIFLLFRATPARPLNELSGNLQERYATCLKLMGDEQYRLAITGFQKLLTDYPDFQLPYRNVVEAYIFLNDLNEAQAYFKDLQIKNPQNPYVLYALARIDFHQNKNQEAIEKLKQCILLDPRFSEAYGPYGGLPEVYKRMDDLGGGENYFRQLINKFPDNPNPYYGLGRIYEKKDRWNEALQLYQKAIGLDSSNAYSYLASSFAYSIKSEYHKALNSSEKLLKISQQKNDLEMATQALLGIGGFYFMAGNFEKSLMYLNRSLNIASEIGAGRRVGMALNNIGAVYATLGNKEKAREYFTESLSLLRKTEAYRTEIRTIYNIGLINKDLKNYQDAFIFLKQALKLSNERGYKVEKCMIVTGLAETYIQIEDLDSALSSYKKALLIAEELDNKEEQGYILKKLGDLYFKLEDNDQSFSQYSKALDIGSRIEHAQIIWEAHTGLGALFQKTNDIQKAIYHFSKAVAIYDSIRVNLNIESLIGGFLEDKYEVYPSIIKLLAQQRRYHEAFQYTEQYKARTLLKIMAKGRFLISELLPDSIRFSLIEIRNQLADAHFELSNELSKGDRDKEKIIKLDQQVTTLELQKSSIIKSVKENYSSYYKITSSDPISLDILQTKILKPGQVLLEFVVGAKGISTFAISPDTLIYRYISTTREELKQMLVSLSPIFQIVTSSDKNYIVSPEQADFSVQPAFELYNTLVKPFEKLINDADELIIAPDDLLHYLPFEALITDTSHIQYRYDFEHAEFLIEKICTSYIQSASLLDPQLQVKRKPSKILIAFGNPISDQKAQQSKAANSADRQNQFLPLPNSEEEVNRIGQLFNGKPLIYTGNNATEKRFKENAGQSQIIHVASHFEVNDYDPLYSKIVFSRADKSNEDGYLQTYEVFNMHLNADLVVLSACNTALGKLNKGEGLIGISRAFMYAGVPGMLVSLWNVEDETTSLIMRNFYKYIKKGFTKNKALQLAKLDFMKNSDRNKKDPFFWAPFILIGDTSPIHFDESRNYVHTVAFIAALLITFISIIIFSKNRSRKDRMHYR